MTDPRLPTDDELSGLRWPLLDVARMLRLARLVLMFGSVTDDEAGAIARHLQEAGGDGPDGLCDCDEVARAFNGVQPQLGPDGWIVPAMSPEVHRVQAQHVAAVAALLVGRQLLDLQPGVSRLASALPTSGFASGGDRLADLNLTALAGRCCRLAADAVFIGGRDEMRTAVIAEERARSKRWGQIGAEKLHAPTRDARELVLAWWKDNRATMNKEQAADAIVAARLVGESRSTIRRWLQGA